MNLVHQLGLRTDHPAKRELNNRKISVLKIAPEEIRGNLHRQGRAFQGNWDYGLEPHAELLGIHVLLEDPKTLVPY